MLGALRERTVILTHNDISQAPMQSALLDFFFFWQRSHNSGIYAKIINEGFSTKFPSITLSCHSALSEMTTCQLPVTISTSSSPHRFCCCFVDVGEW